MLGTFDFAIIIYLRKNAYHAWRYGILGVFVLYCNQLRSISFLFVAYESTEQIGRKMAGS